MLDQRLIRTLIVIASTLSMQAGAADETQDTQATPGAEQGGNALPLSESDDPETDDSRVNWVDTSHAFVTGRAQALTEWMDNFFGDPEHDLEQAESRLRLELLDDWESKTGHDWKLRLRGKVQLPRISRRLDLVFSGEESDFDGEADRRVDDEVGLQYALGESVRSRFEVTMGLSAGDLKPGIKYRNSGEFDDRHSYRFIERVQYADNEKFYSTTQLDLNRAMQQDSVLRLGNRIIWGERTAGVEWRTRLSLFQRLGSDEHPSALSYFLAVSGVTRPSSFVDNYGLGMVWRRQFYRDYLFFEMEPAYYYRKEFSGDDRDGIWSMVVRLEIALRRDLVRGESED